jgi:hypothetical protein
MCASAIMRQLRTMTCISLPMLGSELQQKGKMRGSTWFAAAQELRREFDEQSIRISHGVVKMRSNSQIAFAYSNIDACAS